MEDSHLTSVSRYPRLSQVDVAILTQNKQGVQGQTREKKEGSHSGQTFSCTHHRLAGDTSTRSHNSGLAIRGTSIRGETSFSTCRAQISMICGLHRYHRRQILGLPHTHTDYAAENSKESATNHELCRLSMESMCSEEA